MKKPDISPKMQIFLWSLIPCVFTILNLLLSIKFLFPIVSVWFLWVIWVLVGYKSKERLHYYGKALFFLNWMGFLCLIFAFFYYQNVSVQADNLYWTDGIWLPIHISNNMIGDIFAGLYGSPFLFGGIANWGWYNYEVDMCIVNTITGLALFSLGYLIRLVYELVERLVKVKSKTQNIK